MQIALCQFNPWVGAILHNAARMKDFALKAHQRGAELIIFPELSLCGYPPKDLLFREELHEQMARALHQLASLPIAAIVGAPIKRSAKTGQYFWNAAVLCKDSESRVVCCKQLLPNYDIFDERRYFESGKETDASNLFKIGEMTFGMSICEDAWSDVEIDKQRKYDVNPLLRLTKQGVDIIVNIAASPFSLNKPSFRENLFSNLAQKHQKPLLVVGQVGANDQLIFDGHSMAIDSHGGILSRACSFEEDLLLVEVNPKGELSAVGTQEANQLPSKMALLNQALVLGIRDYVEKCKAPGVMLGLSGGVDSAVCAALAVQALGNKRVIGVRMPSQFSSTHSLSDAKELADNLKIELVDMPIENMLDPFRTGLKQHKINFPQLVDLTDQNLQARVRGVVLMAMSNLNGHLVLTTGNKSELAMSYTTLYGDMCGALSPIGDVYKTDVWKLARFLNQKGPCIPENTILKPPSAELKNNQRDDDTLPAYELLDEVLTRYIDEDMPINQIATEIDISQEELQQIIKTVHLNDYKRRQAAIILMVSKRVFGDGRRWPVCKGFQLAQLLL